MGVGLGAGCLGVHWNAARVLVLMSLVFMFTGTSGHLADSPVGVPGLVWIPLGTPRSTGP